MGKEENPLQYIASGIHIESGRFLRGLIKEDIKEVALVFVGLALALSATVGTVIYIRSHNDPQGVVEPKAERQWELQRFERTLILNDRFAEEDDVALGSQRWMARKLSIPRALSDY